MFPETAVLGEATPTSDPDALVGTEAESFTLGMTAEGTVTAVDSSPDPAISQSPCAAWKSPK